METDNFGWPRSPVETTGPLRREGRGSSSPTTALYTRVAVNTIRDVTSPLERLSLNLAKFPAQSPAEPEAPA
jgi:hypothetical protein